MLKEVTQNISSVFKPQIIQKKKHISLTPLKIKPMNKQAKTNTPHKLLSFQKPKKTQQALIYVQKVTMKGWFQSTWWKIEGISELRKSSEKVIGHLSKQHLLCYLQLKHLRMKIGEWSGAIEAWRAQKRERCVQNRRKVSSSKKGYYGFPCEGWAWRNILARALKFHFEFKAPITTLK